MNKFLFILGINIILVLIQSSFIVEPNYIYYMPNLVLAFAYSLLLMNRSDIGLLSALIGGLLLDLISFRVIGLSSFSLVLLLLITSYIKKYVFKGIVIQLLLLFLIDLLYLLILNMPNLFIPSDYVISIILTCIFSTFFCFIQFKLVHRF